MKTWVKVYQISIPVILVLIGGSVGYDKISSTPMHEHTHKHPDVVRSIDQLNKEIKKLREQQETWHGSG
jgi:hypothetical protein